MPITITYTQRVQRIERTASFNVQSDIGNVFPLFGPIREKEWATDWEPEVIYSAHPEVEEHMIFKTSGMLPDEKFLWVITQYRPTDFMIEYTVSAKDRIWFITVKCNPQGENTVVSVTYSYTGFTEEANQLNKQALEKMFVRNLRDWADAANFYITTGMRLNKEH